MKYYWLTNSLKTKEIGKYPQSISPISLGNITSINNENPFDDTVPINEKKIQLPGPSIHPKSKTTSYLKIDTIGFTVFLVLKNYFLEFLKDFNIPKYQAWSINIYQSKRILKEYYLFRLSYSDDYKYINYTKSEFLIGKLGNWKDPSIRKAVKVESYENYKSLLDVLQSSEDGAQIRCNKSVLNLSKYNVDMFRLIENPILIGYIVSEKLKNAIEEKHYTGMVFKELKDVDNRIEIV